MGEFSASEIEGTDYTPPHAGCEATIASLTAQLAARDARVKALEAALRRCIGTPEGNERDVDGGDGDADLSDVGLFRLGVEHAFADLDSDEEQIIAARRAIEDEARALLGDAAKEEP